MSMNVNGIGSTMPVTAAPATTVAPKTEEEKKKEQKEQAAVYEKTNGPAKQVTYSKSDVASKKMSDADRAKVVQQMKDADAARQKQLIDLVNKTISGQANAQGKAINIQQRLRTGDFTVDAATKAQAQKDIGEDGYYGVKQTSQRLFDFAKALAGDDVEKMKKMQSAMEKGFKQAEKTWGGKLPSICQETINASRKLFDDYFAEQEKATTEV